MTGTSRVPAALDAIASCFEGIVPATICSCAVDGTPNVTYLSIVHRLDEWHVGLSYQFFNKTRTNVLENPIVQVIVVAPETSDQYRLDLQYERTDVAGPFFNRMSTNLAAVASQTGMSQVFTLHGVDVYRVLDCRPVNAEIQTDSAPLRQSLAHVELLTGQLAMCLDLDSLLETALSSLGALFGYTHSFVMIPDEAGQRLYTIASRGYDASGIGSEVWLGEGMLGVAAERRTIVRTTSMTRDVVFSRAVRSSIEQSGTHHLEQEIPLPGLPHLESQVVAPLVAHGELLGILCIQSDEAGRFLLDDERVIQIVGRHLAASMATLRSRQSEHPAADLRRADPLPAGTASTIKHYRSDDSIFVNDAYLIKGIAGRILWKLVRIYDREQRVQFTNREIRLDESLQLPDIKDNLEARLILLRRRLADKSDVLRLVSAGRGRFRLDVRRRLELIDHP
jgi:GAF domain-containing protein/pyridoxamine 5'-phosphate oxidase-like protein